MIVVEVSTPRGVPASFRVREDTNDANLVFSTCKPVGGPLIDEYKLANRLLQGVALDIGAHIGSVTVAMLLDNPGLRVVAVEPVPDNVDLLRENLALNGVANRCTVVEAAADAPGVSHVPCFFDYERFDAHHPDYVRAHRFIGNQYGGEGDPARADLVSAISLGGLCEVGQATIICFAKVDCEGCEWDFLRSPDIGRVVSMMGELHAGVVDGAPAPQTGCESEGPPGCHRCGDPVAHLRRLLEPTHHVRFDLSMWTFEATLRPRV